MEVNSSTSSKGTCNVQVAVRCRPMNSEERKAGLPSVITCDQQEKRIQVSYGPAGKKVSKNFNFDKVFGMYSTQEEVFEQVVRPIVDEVLSGFNCTIFAYGQTGTGKTHTMEGDIHSPENAGIVPRSVKAILEQLEASGSEFTIRVSFLELYNEELQDLLNTSGDKKLKLCEDIKKGVICQNLEEITVLSVTDIFDILQRGIQQRQTAETLCNKNSSRSHSIFTMKIMIKECNVDGEDVVRHGQFNLVDLAGSECVGRSGAKNDRAREAGSINQSLLTLGRVITALVDHHGHIPYRDSKLTRLLQESLGGKAKTCIIATLSPSQLAIEESLSTLDYAHRAKNIKNQPIVNQKMTKKVVLKEYCAEIENLKTQLQITREKNGVYVDPTEFYNMEARLNSQENQLIECETVMKQKNDEIKVLKKDNLVLLSDIDQYKEQINTMTDQVILLTSQLEKTQCQLKQTTIEFQASEQVIREQSNTESSLYSSGQQLQHEVRQRQEDIDLLHHKIHTCISNEANRTQQIQQMLYHMNTKHTMINDTTTAYHTKSSEKHTLLTSGIQDILVRSQGTCTALQTAIDGALSVLLDDAAKAKDTMISSCTDLDTFLQLTKDTVISQLSEVKNGLSQWLSDVDINMKAVRDHLLSQEATLTSMKSNTEDFKSQIMSLTNEISTFQKTSYDEITQYCEQLITVNQQYYDRIISYEAEHCKELQADIDIQAIKMEEALRTMLKDLVTNTKNSLTSHSQNISTYSTDAMIDTKKQMNHMITRINDTQSQNQVKLYDLNTLHDCSYNKQIDLVSKADKERMDSLEQVKSVSDSVLSQKRRLDDCIDHVNKQVETSMIQACTTVQCTSNTADKVLKDIVSCTETMNESTKQNLSEFTTYMNEYGVNYQSEINTFMTLNQDFVNTHSTHIDQFVSDVNTSGNTHNTTHVEVSGQTPKKQRFDELTELIQTRPHDVIKQEIRVKLVDMDIREMDTTHTHNEATSSSCLPVITIMDDIAPLDLPSTVVVENDTPILSSTSTDTYMEVSRNSTNSMKSDASSVDSSEESVVDNQENISPKSNVMSKKVSKNTKSKVKTIQDSSKTLVTVTADTIENTNDM